MKIFIGADHAGYELKEVLSLYLKDLGHEVEDLGAFHLNADDDYPDFIKPVAESVAKDQNSMGVVIGGSGQGEAISANKVAGIRTALFYGQVAPQGSIDVKGEKSADSFEIVALARKHNNANVLSLGARFITPDEAKFACELFLSTPFSGEERHERRIKKLG